MTPEQEDRAAAERDPSPFYADDGRPKMHRHFAQHDVHSDAECTNPGTPRRVYVFDAEDLDRHEAFIVERAKTETIAEWTRIARIVWRNR